MSSRRADLARVNFPKNISHDSFLSLHQNKPAFFPQQIENTVRYVRNRGLEDKMNKMFKQFIRVHCALI